MTGPDTVRFACLVNLGSSASLRDNDKDRGKLPAVVGTISRGTQSRCVTEETAKLCVYGTCAWRATTRDKGHNIGGGGNQQEKKEEGEI